MPVPASPLTRLEGPAALIVLKDLTREQQIERMRSDFVANASHELRTPLASLSGFIETLQGAARSDEKARDKFLSLMRGQVAEDNPWQANTLEWTTTSPPPHGNFATAPAVYRWPYDYSVPDAPADWLAQNRSDASANAAAR